MDSVNKTLYIPLYGKALVSRKGIILQDRKAEEIWAKEQFPLRGKARSKMLAYYTAMRAVAFDKWLQDKISVDLDCIVLHLGCGMDSRAERVQADSIPWYDIDFPAVIAERKRYFQENDAYTMLGTDLKDDAFIQALPSAKRAVIIMEGVSMYLTNGELQALFARLGERYPSIALLVDCYTPFAEKMSKFRNPVKSVGVNRVFGVASPAILETNTKLRFVGERAITPKRCIDELKGFERLVFRRMYAGKISKKLYKLYEYEK